MLYMLLGVLVLVALLAFGFYLHIQKLIASAPKPGPQTVSATQATTLEWQPQLAAVGSITAVRGVDVTTEIAGLVRSIEFKSGQEAKAGAVLVQLNADSDIAQLHSLQAAAELSATVVKRDQAQLEVQAIAQAQFFQVRHRMHQIFRARAYMAYGPGQDFRHLRFLHRARISRAIAIDDETQRT